MRNVRREARGDFCPEATNSGITITNCVPNRTGTKWRLCNAS